jgi:CelD/BcsL family acetyltransferase involved in cellulose biosynthesis
MTTGSSPTPARSTSGGVTCNQLGPRVHPDHDAVLDRSWNRSIFLTADWLDTWFTCFGHGHDVLNLAVRRRGELIGAAPLAVTRARGPKEVRRLVVAGQHPTAGEHLDLVAAGGDEAVVAETVATVLTGALRRRWDVLTVQRVLADSPVLPPLVAALDRAGCRPRVLPSGTSPYTALPDTVDKLLADRSKNFRGQVRQSRNRVNRLGETVEVRRLDNGLDLATGFDELVRLHRARWADESSFDTEAKVAFHRALSRRLAARDRLLLVLLTVDGATVGARYDFVFDDRIWCIQGGWDPEHASARPGMFLTEEVLTWGIERGMREYDFLGGDADYKNRWSTGQRQLVTLTAANPSTVRGRLYGLRQTGRERRTSDASDHRDPPQA